MHILKKLRMKAVIDTPAFKDISNSIPSDPMLQITT